MSSQSALSNVVVMGDRGGLIRWANAGWRELIGQPLDDCAGKPIGSLLDRFSVDPNVVAYVSRRFLAGETCRVEFPIAEQGQERWLQVRVNPERDRDGEVTRFVAIAREITRRVEAESPEIDECDLSPLVLDSAVELVPELGPRASFDASLCDELPPVYGDPSQLRSLVQHWIRRASEAIEDEWGTISLTTGLVGLGDGPIGERYLAAGMPVAPYVFVEVHDTALTSLAEARSRVTDPFLPGRQPGGSVSFPNAVQFAEELGGRVEVQYDDPFGTAVSIVLPA